MINKFKFLTFLSLKRKMKTKWFVIANAILAVVLIAVVNIDSIINKFGGDFNSETQIHVVATDSIYQSFETNLENTIKSLEVIQGNIFSYDLIKDNLDLEEAKKLIEEDSKNWVIILNEDSDNSLNATIVSEGYIDTVPYQILSGSINATKMELALQNSNISAEEYTKINTPIEIDRIYTDGDKSKDDEGMETIMSTVFPIIILPFFMLTIFLVQMIGAEVNDEKSTRGMEIIISNVSPTTHFASKIVAGNLFVIIQGLLLFLFGGIGLLIRQIIGGNKINDGVSGYVKNIVGSVISSNSLGNFSNIIILSLILMLTTFIAYSLLAGILASMTTNTEDFQHLQTPIMLILLAGYYLSMMSGVFKGAIFIRVLSYFPLISAILSPSLLALGQIGIIDVIISIIITIAFNFLLIKYGLKVYKVGILNYSSKGLWKKIFKSITN